MGRKRDSSTAVLEAPPLEEQTIQDDLPPLPGARPPAPDEQEMKTESINEFFRPLVLPPSPHRARVRHLDIKLSREQVDAVAGLTLYLDRRGAMLANSRNRVVRPADAIRWLIDRVAGLDDPSDALNETENAVADKESARPE